MPPQQAAHLTRWSGYEPRSSQSAAGSPVHPHSVSGLTTHRCESGASCSDSRWSCSTSLVTPLSTPPISTAVRRQLTISAAVIVRYRPSKRRSSSIPRRARLSTFTVHEVAKRRPAGRPAERRRPAEPCRRQRLRRHELPRQTPFRRRETAD